jgi:acyl-coenzyme A synthetase/AMP-(fatty) acid ligase
MLLAPATISERRPAGETAYAMARHGRDEDIVAVRAGRPITLAMFLRDVAALSARLPARAYMLNLCTDRYRFMVGFAAALQRRQVSLLPPSDAPGVLQAVAADYPDYFVLSDTAAAAFGGLAYPDDLDGGGAAPGMFAVPEDQPAIILFTSGSTGRPKPVQKTWGPLVRSARAAGARLGVAGPGTVIGTVPHQHSYGFESIILLALQNGLAVDAGWPLYPADIRAAIERAAGARILVTAPVHLRALVAETEMPKLDLILSATAPLAVELAAKAEACFGTALMEIYGCTEAGQIATRRTAHGAEWRCLDGVALRQDADGAWAGGDAVEGTALLQDVIEPVGAEKFLLGGRSADLVDVAGKRTSLAYLHHQLLSIEGVTDGVFFMREPEEKRVARLAALAVAPGVPAAAIMRALREKIDPAFLPRPLVLVAALPRNALGKLPREALLRLLRAKGQ